MVKNVTFQQLKLISRQNKKIRKSLIIAGVFSAMILIFTPFVWGSCGIQHVMINEGLKQYDQEMEPDSCALLVEQIVEFNNDCDSEIEIVDCG